MTTTTMDGPALPEWANELLDDARGECDEREQDRLVAYAAPSALGTVRVLGSQRMDGSTDVGAGFVLELPGADLEVSGAPDLRSLAAALVEAADRLDTIARAPR